MRRVVATAVALGALAAFPAGASAANQDVNILFAQFSPGAIDVLPGETVHWSNISERTHTVTADNDAFDSGDVLGGESYDHTYTTVGAFPYHCTIHAGMTGEIDVRRVSLNGLPTAALPIGTRVDFDGRVADTTQPVTIEVNTGGGYRAIGRATPAADNTWKTTVAVTETGDYRATSGGDVSQSRRMRVKTREIVLRQTKRGVAVRVTPTLPYGRIVLQQHLRERFGWWPVKRTRLDFASRAGFKVKKPARVRVLLVGKDGWTVMVRSKAITLGHFRKKKKAKHRAKPMPHHMEMH
jgi:plastocyanin